MKRHVLSFLPAKLTFFERLDNTDIFLSNIIEKVTVYDIKPNIVSYSTS